MTEELPLSAIVSAFVAIHDDIIKAAICISTTSMVADLLSARFFNVPFNSPGANQIVQDVMLFRTKTNTFYF